MNKSEAKKRLDRLKREVERHRYLYHVLDKQEISDAALDSLKREIVEIENQYPDLTTSNSPSQRVSGEPLKKFAKVRHQVPMLSLQDAFSKEDLDDYEERISKLLPGKELDYFIEMKWDGLTVALTYKDGTFVKGATRGNGLIGEDVTQNLKAIESIPLQLREVKGFPGITKGELIVRGEVLMSKREFERLNKRQDKKGEDQYANPRNVAAGSIRQLDPSVAAARNLDFMAYEIKSDIGQRTHQEVHKILHQIGFSTDSHAKYCKGTAEVWKVLQSWESKRKKLRYWVDGAVIVVDSIKLQKKLGSVGKAERWMVAYKFPAEETTTVVESISVQVGRTGTLTPVANLRPVRIAGTTVSRATLHNQDELDKKDVRVGDTVVIRKAGEIIPEVIRVMKNLRPKGAKKYHIPGRCPICSAKVERVKGEAAYRCTNKRCFAIESEELQNFVSKRAFDIEGVGGKVMDRLIEEGLIADAADIFLLKEGDIEPLERFGEKSAENMMYSIADSRRITFSRFLVALSIRFIGDEMAELLSRYLGNKGDKPLAYISSLQKVDLEELQNIEGIGEKVAESIFEFFQGKKNIGFITKLQKVGIRIKPEVSLQKSSKVTGKSFVLTGTLPEMSREEAKAMIKRAGGNVSSAVSKNTDFVVAGADPGSKYKSWNI